MKKLFKILTCLEAQYYGIGFATAMILFAPSGFVFLLGVALGAITCINLRTSKYYEELK